MTNPFQDSFHNPPYEPYKWLDAGFINMAPKTFVQGGPITASSQTNSSPSAKMFMKVAKPIRLVYDEHGKRYHLTLGDDLPLDVTFTAVHIYTTQYPSGGFLGDQPDILKEIEITLKMRVKNYTIKKIETE